MSSKEIEIICKKCGRIVSKDEAEDSICFNCWNHEIDFTGVNAKSQHRKRMVNARSNSKGHK